MFAISSPDEFLIVTAWGSRVGAGHPALSSARVYTELLQRDPDGRSPGRVLLVIVPLLQRKKLVSDIN